MATLDDTRRHPFIDLTGQRFGQLLVIRRVGSDRHKNALWETVCDCGTVKNIASRGLRAGNWNSCGCYRRRRLGDQVRKHGMSYSPTFSSWLAMLGRCGNPRNPGYKNYGGRGIKVCPEWKESFSAFLRDMGDRPDGHTLDRIDTNGDYTPTNCRWADKKTQDRNRRTNVFIDTPHGRMTIAEAAELAGVHKSTIAGRVRRNWPLDRLLTPRLPCGRPRKTTAAESLTDRL